MSPRECPRQRGVTMIEVLVALLVLSIGMLGVAATLAKSGRFAIGAWAQGAIANDIADIAERLRSTPNAANADFTLTDDYATQRLQIDAGDVTIARDCDSATCTPAQTAAFHLAQWRLNLDRTLPGAAGWLKPLSSATAVTGGATSFEMAVLWMDKANVDSTGALVAAQVCAGTETGAAGRRCCPADSSPAAGVRCTRLVLVP